MERRSRWPLLCAVVLLTGIAVLASQPAIAAALSPATQARGSDGLQDGAANRLLPSMQLRAIEGLAGGSQAQPISPTANGTSLSPIGTSDSASSAAFGWSETGLLQTQGLEPVAYQLLVGTVSGDAGIFGLGDDSSAPTIDRAASSGIHAVCSDNQMAMRLQAGGSFRVPHAAPVQFPPGPFAGSSREVTNPVGDPVDGPSGDRANLSPEGPTGAWCRPPAVPFAQSSPLASRAFWTPFALVFVVIVVFVLSRGVKIPA
jgi:hypothetical protein